MNTGEEYLDLADQFEEAGNIRGAFAMLLAGAKCGNQSCQVNLANYYAEGKAVRANFEEARRWYKRAFRTGSRGAAYNMALEFLRRGDIRNARAWAKRAMALEEGEAYVLMAKMSKTKAIRKKLLEYAIQMSSDDIFEDTKKEAELLLATL